jgi:hypothetical protein
LDSFKEGFRFTFSVDDPRQPDDPLNSSKHNRYLTVFFASRPDGEPNVWPAQLKSPLIVRLKIARNGTKKPWPKRSAEDRRSGQATAHTHVAEGEGPKPSIGK